MIMQTLRNRAEHCVARKAACGARALQPFSLHIFGFRVIFCFSPDDIRIKMSWGNSVRVVVAFCPGSIPGISLLLSGGFAKIARYLNSYATLASLRILPGSSSHTRPIAELWCDLVVF